MSWFSILLVIWVAVGLLAGLAFLLLAARANRHQGYELERNPIAWIPFVSVCVLAGPPLIAIVLVGVPVLAVMSLFGTRRVEEAGYQARFLDQGLEIYNPEGTIERVIEWVDVERAEMVFSPPLMCPDLILRDGERVWLHMVSSNELAPVLEQHGIPFNRRTQRLELDADDSIQEEGEAW